ncbi:hypothetical protein PV325_003460 [Microctonus aethiopoides]|nr:hypothetical protein PV325_003460 [Microctonus aethiopoides]
MKMFQSALKNISILYLLLNFFTSDTECVSEKLNILGVFSHPGKSHFDAFKPLLEELARRGHELTVVSYFPRDNTSVPLLNYHDIDLANSVEVFVNVVNLMEIKHTLITQLIEVTILRDWALKCCRDSLSVPKVKELIKSDAKFDLIITEAFNSPCFLGFVHRFNAPFISLSSHVLMPWANNLGNPENPSYVPNIFHGFSSNMNIYQRLINTISKLYMNFFYEFAVSWSMHSIVEEAFGPGVPPLNEIARKESAMLVNTHYSLQGAKPNVPTVIEVGGLHIQQPKPLPNNLKKFLDDAHEGVLYFSWGSMIKASTMSNHTLNEILKAIGNIPRKVIWKWENENLPNKPKNVLIQKWLPQAAILKHPNVKSYLAHGGLLGLSEGVHYGVPMVVVPMFGDQFNNAAAARERGVAIVLEWSTLDANTLRSAIDRVFNDSSYQRNAKLLQKAYNDRPATALQTAVWWAEYIARGNGDNFIKSHATLMSWYQIALIDVAHFDARVSPEMSIPLTNTSNGNLAATQTNTRPDDIRKRVIGAEDNKNSETKTTCGTILIGLSWVVVILTMPFSLFVCFKVVQEYERAVIFRLGRLLSGGAKGPGIFFILPCIDAYARVDLRTRTYDVPPQEVLTKDSVTVSVDAVVYYRVNNATISIANVENAHHSTRLLAQTTLRNTMGTRPLHEILSERETISTNMQASLDEATDSWGIKVERVEIKDVRLPVQLQRAMAAEAEAAREARAKVIAAEGEQKASRALREASEVIGDSPAALQLRYLQTLNTISAEKNSTIVFPLPIDMLTYFMKAGKS